jgi:hypothetical protein
MRCQICKRRLTDPVSVRLGIGPVCRAGHNTIEQGELDFMGRDKKVDAIAGFGDVVCNADGTTNIPHRIVRHSPLQVWHGDTEVQARQISL